MSAGWGWGICWAAAANLGHQTFVRTPLWEILALWSSKTAVTRQRRSIKVAVTGKKSHWEKLTRAKQRENTKMVPTSLYPQKVCQQALRCVCSIRCLPLRLGL